MSTFVRPRNETHLDALGVTMVKLPSPPHLVETSPDGSLLVAATPHGATFYWPPNVNNADGSAAAPANAVHSVALNERISALAFLPQGARQGAAEGGPSPVRCDPTVRLRVGHLDDPAVPDAAVAAGRP